MAHTWMIARVDTTCGYDGGPISAGEPMQEIRLPGSGPHARYRCRYHAIGGIDLEAIETARQASREAVDTAERRAIVGESSCSEPRNPRRFSRPTSVKRFSSLGDLATTFDPKAAAAGDRD